MVLKNSLKLLTLALLSHSVLICMDAGLLQVPALTEEGEEVYTPAKPLTVCAEPGSGGSSATATPRPAGHRLSSGTASSISASSASSSDDERDLRPSHLTATPATAGSKPSDDERDLRPSHLTATPATAGSKPAALTIRSRSSGHLPSCVGVPASPLTVEDLAAKLARKRNRIEKDIRHTEEEIRSLSKSFLSEVCTSEYTRTAGSYEKIVFSLNRKAGEIVRTIQLLNQSLTEKKGSLEALGAESFASRVSRYAELAVSDPAQFRYITMDRETKTAVNAILMKAASASAPFIGDG